jgi:hypothetical protein
MNRTKDEIRTTHDAKPLAESRFGDARRKRGSAIILAIVLTSLLAIIGVLFLISSRVDSIATSSIADNEDLTLAVDTVVAQISEDLAEDIAKGAIDPNCYADYPDPCNFWLASLEPYQFGTDYFWRQVSNIYGPTAVQIVQAQILPDYNTAMVPYTEADADGDGVSDSMWVKLPDKSSGKGKPIYAAVRIIDNGAMLNVNTGFKFDPSSSVGVSQMDINLMALSWRPNNPLYPYDPTTESTLRLARNPSGLPNYENNVIWQYGLPNGAYTPFDISDELELRYRYLVNQQGIDTRAEVLPLWELRTTSNYRSPVDSNLSKWFINSCPDTIFDVNYAYRHIATTYNCDRIIRPDGGKMININNPDINVLDVCDVIKAALIEGGMPVANADSNAAQIAANLIDYRDDNNDITVVSDSAGILHFGFERPCIYISEIAANFTIDASNKLHTSYAIELYNPYYGIDLINPAEWQIQITLYPPIGLTTWQGDSRFHIIWDIDNLAPLDYNHFTNPAPNVRTYTGLSFAAYNTIALQRKFPDNSYITVDEVIIPPDFPDGTTPQIYSRQRDITLHKCIRRLWNSSSTSALGNIPKYVDASSDIIQAHPANKPFTNVGEIGQLFYAPTYHSGGVGPDFTKSVTEPEMRIDLALPQYQQIFKYLTVIDPCGHGVQAVGESRIKGRININTAPWFVIAQLPWVSYQNYDIARSIVNKREMRGGYKSIGELMIDANSSNDNIGYYISNPVPPVLITPDDPPNDDVFEKRDVIFARISNLVTVRSDVFTAYILVRIGQNGPQKRVIAILDRSEVPAKPVKVIAIQSVPDPR